MNIYSNISEFIFIVLGSLVFILLIIHICRQDNKNSNNNFTKKTRRLINRFIALNPLPTFDQYLNQQSTNYKPITDFTTRFTTRQELINNKQNVIPIVLNDLPPLLPLHTDIHGIIAKRNWSFLSMDTELRSEFINYCWKNQIETSEKIHGNMYGGLHAYKINNLYIKLDNTVTGLVELRGKVIEHKDGVLRAEWARILFLMCNNYDDCVYLSKRYEVPVVLVNRNYGVFLNQEWMNKIKEGYKWVQTQI